uniref:Uncharacterized protein n=1 Tax=Octopus bimaculoides TaxID=37653 RepID=A0A0L8HVX5_OCTBM
MVFFTCHLHRSQSRGTGNDLAQNGAFHVSPAQEPVQGHRQRSRSKNFMCHPHKSQPRGTGNGLAQ